jgi:hypothetical protein
MQRATMKLVEDATGVGDLGGCGGGTHRVRYRISRYQGMLVGSGMPVPGVHRLEGSVDLAEIARPESLVGETLTLTLEDGRAIAVRLADATGRILVEGHGPGRCSCC